MGTRYGSRYGTATDVAASLGRPRHAASAVGGRVYPNERPPAVAAAGLQIRNLLETAALGPHKWRVALYCPICVEGGPGRPGQPDDVEIVTFDRLDQSGSPALDRVAARAVPPLAGRDVPINQALVERPELDQGADSSGVAVFGPEQAKPADHRVRAPRQSGQGFPRPFGVAWLAVDPAVDAHDRVDAEHRSVAVNPGDGQRLAPGVLRGGLLGFAFQQLFGLRDEDREAHAQLLEDRAPLRRARREDQ